MLDGNRARRFKMKELGMSGHKDEILDAENRNS
jgi:hypothetical protein